MSLYKLGIAPQARHPRSHLRGLVAVGADPAVDMHGPTLQELYGMADGHFRQTFPEAPFPLDPHDPAQKVYVEAWLRIFRRVKADWTAGATPVGADLGETKVPFGAVVLGFLGLAVGIPLLGVMFGKGDPH